MGHNNTEGSIRTKNRFYARVDISSCVCVCLCKCRNATTYSIGLQINMNTTWYIVTFYVICVSVIKGIPAANTLHFMTRRIL
jgi:hypothetical protein